MLLSATDEKRRKFFVDSPFAANLYDSSAECKIPSHEPAFHI